MPDETIPIHEDTFHVCFTESSTAWHITAPVQHPADDPLFEESRSVAGTQALCDAMKTPVATAISSADSLALRRLAQGLLDAPRHGSTQDEPEGSQTILLSDTLARDIAVLLIRLAEEQLVLHGDPQATKPRGQPH